VPCAQAVRHREAKLTKGRVVVKTPPRDTTGGAWDATLPARGCRLFGTKSVENEKTSL